MLLSDLAHSELARRIAPSKVPDGWLADLTPHPGPQQQFLESTADIVIYGGAAGSGKSWGLLVEPLRHVHDPSFGCVIFRREMTRITNEGGMWDEAEGLYIPRGATPRQSPRMEFRFPSRAKIQFGHLEHEKTKHAWSGAQVPLMEFDQLEEFTEGQFWFLLSRGRTKRGLMFRARVRATANPVPPEDETGGWLAKLIQWWWDEETGYPIPERSGVVRWFVRVDEAIAWADSREQAVELALDAGIPEREAEEMPKSLTFIPARHSDNPSLDPSYIATLRALPLVERERLLGGNWKIRPAAGLIFDRSRIKVVPAVPADTIAVRYWDKAATPGGGDHSAGLRLDYCHSDGKFYVTDLERGQWSYGDRNAVMDQKAIADGRSVPVWMEQEPGSGGKESAEASIRQLAGFDVHAERSTGSKLDRARPVAAQAEVGNVCVVQAPWTEGFLQRLHNFTGRDGGKDDDVDALAGAFNRLAERVAEGRVKLMARPAPSPHKPPVAERARARAERRRDKAMAKRGQHGGARW